MSQRSTCAQLDERTLYYVNVYKQKGMHFVLFPIGLQPVLHKTGVKFLLVTVALFNKCANLETLKIKIVLKQS